MIAFVRLLVALAVAVLCIPGSAHSAAYQTVDMPAINVWCSARTLTEEQAQSVTAVDQERDSAATALDMALAAQNIGYSGLPFVAATSQAAPTNRSALGATAAPTPAPNGVFHFDVCVTVAGHFVTPPASFVGRTQAAAKYATLSCGPSTATGTSAAAVADAAAIEDACIGDLRKAMLDQFGSAQKEAIFQSAVQMTHVAADPSGPSVVTAFALAADRATSHGVAVSGSGAAWTPDPKSKRPPRLNAESAVVILGAPAAYLTVVAIAQP